MSERRSRTILACVMCAESAWLYALLSLIGLLIGMDGSPLPWLTVFLLLLVAAVSGYVFGGSRGEDASLAIWQALVAVVAIYLLLGTGSYTGSASFDIAWIVKLVSGKYTGVQVASVVFGVIASVWLVRRGLKLAADRYPEDQLARVFKLGIAVLAVAVIVDEASNKDIGAGMLLLPFFAASLVGLAVGRLPEGGGGRSGAQWARTIAVSVLGVMGAGLLLGLIGGLYGGGGVKLLFAGWGMVVDGILWVLRYPVTGLIYVFDWFFGLFGRDRTVEAEPQQSGPQSGQEILGIDPSQGNGSSEVVDTIVNILQYPVIIIIVVVVFFLIALAFRRFGRRGDEEGDDERESLRGDADTAGDMARLLGSLVPGWLKGKQGKVWRYPDEPGIAEVFQLYFKTVMIGTKWGVPFDPNVTPSERLPLLEAALPGAPVRQVTERFNAACYGMEPTDAQIVAELDAGLTAAERSLQGH